jgi:RNA polymerase sigma factor (sigma-70 family)
VDEPPNMDSLNATPGAEWSDADTIRVKRWWASEAQMKRVWIRAADGLDLGVGGVSIEDVHDAMTLFFQRFDAYRKSYQPGGLPFCDFVLNICFGRDCWRMGKKIRRLHATEVSSQCILPDGEYVLEAENAGSDPAQQADRRAFLAELSRALNTGVVSERQKQAFVLHYIQERSHKDIAHIMNAPVGTVGAWISRARNTLREYLRKGGGWNEPP